ncbi:MAG: hypothetical protein V5A23_00205 [Halobacteriales archaeon]
MMRAISDTWERLVPNRRRTDARVSAYRYAFGVEETPEKRRGEDA